MEFIIYLKRLFLLAATLTVFFLLFISCGESKKPAIGQEDEIIVIADSTDYLNLESSLLTAFSRVIYTPQPEVLFNLTRKDFSKLDKHKNYKNILFVAPLGANSDVSKYLDHLLSGDVKKLVNSDSASIINKHDLWAKNQLVMILTSSSLNKLNENILKEADNLLHYFQKASDSRLFASLYNERFEQKKIEAKLLKDYGWMVYVQSDFLLAQNDSVEKFVWLRRAPGTDMERWIFVHWIDNASPALLDKDSVAAIRNRITEKFFSTADDSSYVEISGEYKTTHEVNFLNRYALMSQGLWRMKDLSMGGPFINYTFYDEHTKRLYMLDGSIYAPKYYKKKLLQQVDVILQSFLTERELSKERKESLLEELE